MSPLTGYKLRIIIICLFLWFGVLLQVRAQDNADLELRGTYTLQHYITKYRFWFRNDIGIRRSFDHDPFAMFLLRPRAIIELGSIVDLHPGIDFRYSNYLNSVNTFEIRTWEGVSIHWPDVGRIMFEHFYRFEQRFHWTDGENEEETGLRSRYRLNMRIPLNNRSLIDKTWFLDLQGEIFIPHDEEIQEFYTSRMRFGTIVGYRRSLKWRFQLAGYFESGWNTVTDERTVNHYIIEARVRTSL